MLGLGLGLPKSRVLGGFNPFSVGAGLLMFWSKAINIPRTEWNTPNYQLNNEIDTLPPRKENRAIQLDETNSDLINPVSTISGIRTIAFWFKASDSTINAYLDGQTEFIEVTGGDVIPDSGTGYSNGTVAGATVGSDEWMHVVVTYSTPHNFTTSDLITPTTFGVVTVKDVCMFSTELTAAEVLALYQSKKQELIEVWAQRSDALLVAPLADYEGETSITAGELFLDYSGNGNDLKANGTSVESVFARALGYQVSEDKYNIVSGQYLYDIGNGNDIEGDPIAAFVGAAAPDAQLSTGGGVSLTAANTDYMNFVLFSGSNFTINLYLNYNVLVTLAYLVGGVGTSSFIQRQSTGFRVRLSGGIMDFLTGFSSSGWHMLTVVSDNTNVTLYEDGVEIDQVAKSGSNTAWQYIGRRSADYATMQFTDFFISETIWTPAQILDLYNNPNEFVSRVRADANMYCAYSFDQGIYSAGQPFVDVSGKKRHGSVAGATSNMAINNLIHGSQTALRGWKKYGYVVGTGTISSSGTTVTGVGTAFTTQLAVGDLIWKQDQAVKVASIASNTSLTLEEAPSTAFTSGAFNILDQNSNTINLVVPTISNDSDMDVFGNVVDRQWKEGLLNFTGLQDGAVLIPNAGTLKQRTYGLMALQKDVVSAGAASILDAKASNAGITLYQNSNDLQLRVEDDTSTDESTVTFLNITSSYGENGWYVFGVNVEPDGTIVGFIGDDDEEMALFSEETSEPVGIDGSDNFKIGVTRSAPYDRMLTLLMYNDNLTIEEQEKLREKFLIELIP